MPPQQKPELNFQCNRSMSTDSPYRTWNNHKTQSPKNECKTISTEERCRQYCFKCISASTWGSHQKIGNKNQLNDFCNDNAVAKTPCSNPTGLHDSTNVTNRSSPKSQFYHSFWLPTSISCESVATDTSKSQFYLSFWRPTSISRERFATDLRFWRPTSISFCERVAADTSKSQFYVSFWRSTSISCERVAADTPKSQFYLGFGRPMCTKWCACHVSWRSGGTAPALRER